MEVKGIRKMNKRSRFQEFVIDAFLWLVATVVIGATIFWIALLLNGFFYLVRNA